MRRRCTTTHRHLLVGAATGHLIRGGSFTRRWLHVTLSALAPGELGNVSEVLVTILRPINLALVSMLLLKIALLLLVCLSSAVGLAACPSGTLLLGSTNKCTMSHIGCVLAVLLTITETLRSIQFLYLSKGLVMIVAFKQLLNARPLQLGLMLEHLFRVGIFPLAVCVLRIKVIFILRGHEWCLHSLLPKSFPVEIGEPFVFFNDMWAFLAQPIRRLSLD